MPAPPLPNPDTPQGKEQLRFSMLTGNARISVETSGSRATHSTTPFLF
jgi:hypothetical protein